MEENIHFEAYNPSYEKYFQILEEDESIKEYVYFTKYNSSLIFLENECVGFYKLQYREYDSYDIQDNEDCQSIYDTLENKIIPIYYNRQNGENCFSSAK